MINVREVNALLGPDNPATMTTDIDIQLITKYSTVHFDTLDQDMNSRVFPGLMGFNLWRLLTRPQSDKAEHHFSSIF